MEQNAPGHQEGKEAYERKKEERLKAKTAASKTDKRRWFVKRLFRVYLGWILVAVGAAYAITNYIQGTAPVGQDFSKAIPEMTREHIAVGAAHPAYNSNPPTSGWHYGETARTGFRDSAVPDEHIIHNLEHGNIWISYHPRIPQEIVESLKTFAGPKVIIAPREANDSDIALAAWGRLDTFNIENNILDEQRIRDFINRYINKGPEQITTPAHGGV
ncbi:MAG: DUF3105 domain-containing protein [Candidatus Liptonbacteria bacterium]|nr:DUF3105 domain-containing protein [Candidatus Liptonbacteria bacterium]